jgi:hypothetical protein
VRKDTVYTRRSLRLLRSTSARLHFRSEAAENDQSRCTAALARPPPGASARTRVDAGTSKCPKARRKAGPGIPVSVAKSAQTGSPEAQVCPSATLPWASPIVGLPPPTNTTRFLSKIANFHMSPAKAFQALLASARLCPRAPQSPPTPSLSRPQQQVLAGRIPRKMPRYQACRLLPFSSA